MSRPKIFASDEEWYISWWLTELQAEGYIQLIEYQPGSFELYEGKYNEYVVPMKRVEDKIEHQALLQPHIYTCDVRVVWTDKAEDIFYWHEGMYGTKKPKHLFYSGLEHEGMVTYFEVKAEFDRNNMNRLAGINIKWVQQKYGVIVEMIKPNTLFKNTFTPDRFLLTNKSFTPRTIKYETRSLTRYVALVQEKASD